MNETTTERILRDIAKDIRQSLADVGVLCEGCNADIEEELKQTMDGLRKADTAIEYALCLKKHPNLKEGA